MKSCMKNFLIWLVGLLPGFDVFNYVYSIVVTFLFRRSWLYFKAKIFPKIQGVFSISYFETKTTSILDPIVFCLEKKIYPELLPFIEYFQLLLINHVFCEWGGMNNINSFFRCPILCTIAGHIKAPFEKDPGFTRLTLREKIYKISLDHLRLNRDFFNLANDLIDLDNILRRELLGHIVYASLVGVMALLYWRDPSDTFRCVLFFIGVFASFCGAIGQICIIRQLSGKKTPFRLSEKNAHRIYSLSFDVYLHLKFKYRFPRKLKKYICDISIMFLPAGPCSDYVSETLKRTPEILQLINTIEMYIEELRLELEKLGSDFYAFEIVSFRIETILKSLQKYGEQVSSLPSYGDYKGSDNDRICSCNLQQKTLLDEDFEQDN